MDELIEYIYELRTKEGIPLHFRRAWLNGYDKKPFWYVWYGYTPIAYRVDQETARHAIDVAVIVHNEIHKDLKPIRAKAA